MGRFWSGWLAWLCLLLSASAQGAPDWSRPPGVVVFIQVQPDGTYFASWTFDRRVPHTQVRERLQQLHKWSGQSVAEVEIGDDSLKRDAKPHELMTVATFRSLGLVNLREGTLDLTPIVRTFADIPVIHVYTLLPQQVNYMGYTHYSTPHLSMWTQAEPQLWRTVVELHTPDPMLLSIPPKRPAEQPQPAPTPAPASRISPWSIVASLALAFAVGVGIFWGVSYLLKRQTERESVSSKQELGG